MNLLEDMGFPHNETFTTSGLETPVEEMVEFIDAANVTKADDPQGAYMSSGTVECIS